MNDLKKQKKWPAVIGIIIAVLAIAYLGMTFFLMERFFPGTQINGVDCSWKTKEQVEDALKEYVQNYKLQFVARDGMTEERSSQDFGLIYEGSDGIAELLNKQDPFLWFMNLGKKDSDEVDIKVSYTKNKLVSAVSSLEFMQPANQVAPVSATIAFDSDYYYIVKEVVGNKIDSNKIYSVVQEYVSNLEPSLNLEEAELYLKPKYTTNSKEVHSALQKMNQYVSTEITFQFGTKEVVLDHETICNWLSVDKDLNVIFDETQVKSFVFTLSEAFDTPNEAQIMTTPNGREVSIENAKRGTTVDVEAEALQLVEDIKSGTVTTRKPIFSQEGTPEGEYGWGTSYIEVDMKEQHMWFIKNGEIIFESDVVTGKPSTPTPTGMYRIREKKEDAVLRGAKKPDGTYEYESPVNYWMRLTWSGIGLHDATWQSSFGGERYKNGHGSHGCINMPLNKAKELYSMVSEGDRVVLHN